MNAMSLTACDNTGKTDVTDQSLDAIEKAEEMKDDAIDVIQPEAPTE